MEDSKTFILLILASWVAGAALNIIESFLHARREQTKLSRFQNSIFGKPEKIDRTSIILSIITAAGLPAVLAAIRAFGVVSDITASTIGYLLATLLSFAALYSGFLLCLGLLMRYMNKDESDEFPETMPQELVPPQEQEAPGSQRGASMGDKSLRIVYWAEKWETISLLLFFTSTVLHFSGLVGVFIAPNLVLFLLCVLILVGHFLTMAVFSGGQLFSLKWAFIDSGQSTQAIFNMIRKVPFWWRVLGLGFGYGYTLVFFIWSFFRLAATSNESSDGLSVASFSIVMVSMSLWQFLLLRFAVPQQD